MRVQRSKDLKTFNWCIAPTNIKLSTFNYQLY